MREQIVVDWLPTLRPFRNLMNLSEVEMPEPGIGFMHRCCQQRKVTGDLVGQPTDTYSSLGIGHLQIPKAMFPYLAKTGTLSCTHG